MAEKYLTSNKNNEYLSTSESLETVLKAEVFNLIQKFLVEKKANIITIKYRYLLFNKKVICYDLKEKKYSKIKICLVFIPLIQMNTDRGNIT